MRRCWRNWNAPSAPSAGNWSGGKNRELRIPADNTVARVVFSGAFTGGRGRGAGFARGDSRGRAHARIGGGTIFAAGPIYAAGGRAVRRGGAVRSQLSLLRTGDGGGAHRLGMLDGRRIFGGDLDDFVGPRTPRDGGIAALAAAARPCADRAGGYRSATGDPRRGGGSRVDDGTACGRAAS